jgi:hypothetical protein
MKTHKDIDGFFDYEYLYGPVADQMPNGGTIVEVGSWVGQSMAFMAQRLQAKGWHGNLVAVDGFTGEMNQPAHMPYVASAGGNIRHIFDQNMRDCGIEKMVRVIEGDSAGSAEYFDDGSVDFCFIDAAHDYESVVRDIAAWLPKMRPGGIMAGHDYPFVDVYKAVLETFCLTGYSVLASCWYKNMPTNVTPAQWREALQIGRARRQQSLAGLAAYKATHDKP